MKKQLRHNIQTLFKLVILGGCCALILFFSGCSTVQTSQTQQTKVIAYAKQFVGTPYCGAGQTTKCFDCSGYVTYCFLYVGSTLPRSSQDIAKAGSSVSISNIELADIVIFSSSVSSISHVGIYAGNNTFYHASTTKGVMLSSLNDSYWKPRLQGARRYL